MILFPIILATIFGFATSVPADSLGIKDGIYNVAETANFKAAALKELLETFDMSTRNSVIENMINNAIDIIRDIILYGSDAIPVLDPFKLEKLHVTGDIVDIVDLPNSHVTLQNMTMENLGTFEIDQLRVTTVSLILQRYRIELDGRIPVLNVETDNYDLSINIFGGNIFGNGQMNLQIVNPRVYANIVIGVRLSINGIFLEVRECNLRVNLDAFEVRITGLFGNEVSSEFVSNFLSSLVPELLEYFEEDITNTLSSTVLEIANEILRDLNIIDLLP